MNRALILLVPAVAALLGASCSGGSGRAAAPSPPWTGARALTGKEDAPRGVVTDGARVLFTTGRTQVGENALREVSLERAGMSHIVAVTPGGLIPNGHVALDGAAIYLAAGTGIVRLSAGGADAVTVVRNRPAAVDDLVVVGDDLWWTTYQFGAPERVEVARMPKAGGPVEVVAVNIAGGLGRPYPERSGVAVVGSPKGVLRVQAGRPPEVVAGSDAVGGAVTRMVVDDDRLYVVVSGDKHRLLAVPRRGGPPVVLTDDVDTEGDIVLAGDDVVYFAARAGSSGRSELRSVARTGGPPRTIASGPYADGDLAAVGADQVVFSADSQVWVTPLR